MVWSLALCPDDTKQDSMVYGAEFGVVFLAKGPRTTSNVASMLSRPVLISVCPDRKPGGRRDCYFANPCSESGSCGERGAQRVGVARARAPRDAAVQRCLEYLGS